MTTAIETFTEFLNRKLALLTESFSPLGRGDTVFLYFDNEREECIGTVTIIDQQDDFLFIMRSRHVGKAHLTVEPKSVGPDLHKVRDWLQGLADWRMAQPRGDG